MLIDRIHGKSEDWSEADVSGSITKLICPICKSRLSVIDTKCHGQAWARLHCVNGHEVAANVAEQSKEGAILLVSSQRKKG